MSESTSRIESIGDVRAFIAHVASTLDPKSRYISELLDLVDEATSVDGLEAKLTTRSRGQRHAGADVFASMSLRDKLLTNLITSETALFRFADGELEALATLSARPRTAPLRVLIVPCSHGEEAFTVAAQLLRDGTDFGIDAFDVQPALIDEARTGRLTFGYPLEHLERPGYVSATVLERINFEVGDAFALPLCNDRRFDVVLCRNFIGYFVPEKAAVLVDSLAAHVGENGLLFLDGFCLVKMPRLLDVLATRGLARLDKHPIFRRVPHGSQ